MNQPAPVCIVGVGSAHGADRAGWQAIDELEGGGLLQRFPPGDLALHRCAVPLRLVDLLEGCRLALLIDAVRAAPGALLRLDAGALAASTAPFSSHGVGVAESLRLLAALADPAPRVVIIGIGVGDPPAAEPPVVDPEALAAVLEAEIDRFSGALISK